jgi:hypothetical protein
MRPGHQFECKVVLYFELDLKSNSRILNWFGSPLCCARPWCPVRPTHHLHNS